MNTARRSPGLARLAALWVGLAGVAPSALAVDTFYYFDPTASGLVFTAARWGTSTGGPFATAAFARSVSTYGANPGNLNKIPVFAAGTTYVFNGVNGSSSSAGNNNVFLASETGGNGALMKLEPGATVSFRPGASTTVGNRLGFVLSPGSTLAGSNILDIGAGALLDFKGVAPFYDSASITLRKSGAGTLALGGEAVFAGSTTLTSGTLFKSGDASGTASAATLNVSQGSLLLRDAKAFYGNILYSDGTRLMSDQDVTYLDVAGVAIRRAYATTSTTVNVTTTHKVNGTLLLGGDLNASTLAANLGFVRAMELNGTGVSASPSPVNGLTIGGNGAYTFNTAFAGTNAGGTLNIGAEGGRVGRIVFAASNTFAGSQLNVDGGTLEIANGGSVGASTHITVNNGGTLVVNGSIGGGSGVLNLAAGSVLKGSGAIHADLMLHGVHAPGNSPGLQTVDGQLAYASDATLQWELAGQTDAQAARGASFDGIDGTAGHRVSIDAAAHASLVFNGAGSSVDYANAFWSSNHSWLVMAGFDGVDGTFQATSVSADADGDAWGTGLTASGSFAWRGQGGNLYLDYSVASVPEPHGGLLALVAAPVLFGALRRRQARREPAAIKH